MLLFVAFGTLHIDVIAQQPDHRAYAVTLDDRFVGVASLMFHSGKPPEIGYWLGEPFWGKGIVSRAIARMCGQAFARYDIIRIHGEPYAYNIGSRRALEKADFAFEGIKKNSVYKNGIIHDSCMYALLK